ncbi:hypothetical protein Rhopal_004958-T1 [Rhodotorula paludigena]|uniref:Uncharacterized protein n=1 Tax=Rhodotorula paludigena TaxID=86838 RepID=A0AAV5GP47_9BASI|nr:hypothetical protein Rhopal_004958-T1 [Rhodotorula paludigena]
MSAASSISSDNFGLMLRRIDSLSRSGARKIRFEGSVYSASCAFSDRIDQWEITLYRDNVQVGKVVLDSLQVGSNGAVPARKFYRRKGLFSEARTFQLGGVKAMWQAGKEGSRQLVNSKSGEVLAKVAPVARDASHALPLDHITVYSTAIAGDSGASHPRSQRSVYPNDTLPSSRSTLAPGGLAYPRSPCTPSSTASGARSYFSSLQSQPSTSTSAADDKELNLILLTLLHQDLLTLEEAREVAEREHEREEMQAW